MQTSNQTTVKVSIYNGDTKLKFSYTQDTNVFDSDKAKNYIIDRLLTIVEKQKRLKQLGVKKNNFFGLSEAKENFIDIDLISGDEVTTYTSGLTFKLSALKNLEIADKKEAFGIIFDMQTSNLLIE